MEKAIDRSFMKKITDKKTSIRLGWEKKKKTATPWSGLTVLIVKKNELDFMDNLIK